MKVYANWRIEEVISKEKYEEQIAKTAADYVDDDDMLAEFLGDLHSRFELFNMTEEERAEVRGDFAEWCHRKAEDDLDEDWQEYEV
jgi:hypothetical protein